MTFFLGVLNRLFQEKTVSSVLKIFAGSLLLFACSQISIPLRPIPVTLQTLAVMLIGLTYTPEEAWKSLGLWLGAGIAGLPVFANFLGGLDVVMGPRGGYLLGCFLAGPLMAWIQEKISTSWKKNVSSAEKLLSLCVAGFFALSVVFFFGVARLAFFIGLSGALQYGFLPFLLPEIVKIFLLCGCVHLLKRH